jgi:hypothetical protein
MVPTCNVIAVGGCASTATEDVRGQVMDLLTVLVTDDGTTRGSSISCEHDTVLSKREFNIFWLIEKQNYHFDDEWGIKKFEFV